MLKTKKSRAEQLLDIADLYSREVEVTYTTHDLFAFAEDRNLWEPRHTREQIFCREMHQAMQREVDEDGVRCHLCIKVQGKFQWCRRGDASWGFRQEFIDDQARRIGQDTKSLERLLEKFNAERRKGERVFEIHWDT